MRKYVKNTLALLLAAVLLLPLLVSCVGPDIPSGNDPVDLTATDEPTPAKKVVINELMADNPAFVMNCADDWIELYNDEDEDLRLSSYYLTKRQKGGRVLSLDGKTIPAKGYLTIRLTEDSPFRLSKDGDSVLLLCATGLVDELAFDASIGENSFSHEGVCEFPTPGYPNTLAGYEDYIANLPVPGVRINEILPSNGIYLPVGENFYDLVEIYNGSGADIDLSRYWLSDKKSEPKRYNFPAITLPDGGYFIVYCSGLIESDHASFKISSLGETVFLSDGSGFVDAIRVPDDVPRNESYGRNGTDLVYMSEVTMGYENAAGYSARPSVPVSSVASGAYDEPFTVTLSAPGEIRYTLDGTEPNGDSPVYSEPIEVTDITSIRAYSIENGRSSRLVSFFYIVDKDHAYPVVNVAIKQEYLDGERGVLNHVDPEYEHEAFVTMMDGGEELFSVPCGFKLHGNDSKKGEKQNFQLRFRSEYGLSKLEYKVFENRDYTTFNSLLLKGGSEDYPFCCFRDELCAALVDGLTNLETQAYRPVILYLNGQYWGFYWLRERFDARNLANRLGVSKDSITQLKDYGEAAVDGTNSDFMALVNYCKKHDLRNGEDYNYVMERIDHVSMMDWYICRSFMSDTDLANIRMFNSTEDDGRWHWCFFDLDWSFWIDRDDPIGTTARNDGHHEIILALLKNPDFRDMFLRRYAELLDTAFSEERILSLIDGFVEIMRPEIEADRARYRLSVSAWESNIEKLRDFVRNGKRRATVLAGIKRYFSLTEAEMTAYFGG